MTTPPNPLTHPTPPERLPPVIMAIDPASRQTGYALIDADGGVLEAGIETPEKGLLSRPAHVRVPSIATGLISTLAYARPTIRRVIVEVPSGGPGTGSKRGASSSLIVYGYAAGFIAAKIGDACLQAGVDLEMVTEADWTVRFGQRCDGAAKPFRIAYCAARYAEYRAMSARNRDPGGDIADAICLGLDGLTRLQPSTQHAGTRP